MADRRAELERKKAKLEQMRASKKTKLEGGDAESEIKPSMTQEDLHAKTDKMMMELGITIPHDTSSMNRAIEVDKSIQDTSLPSSSSAKRNYNLSSSQITQTNIMPKGVTYSKETQTSKELLQKEDEDNDSLDVSNDPSTPLPPRTRTFTAGDLNEAEQPEPEKPVVKSLTEEEKSEIFMTSEFQTFLNRTSRFVERAINEKIDIFTDYTGLDNDENKNILEDGEEIKINRKFMDERWTKDRNISSIEWSHMFPELLMASYNKKNETMVQEPNGVVLIWNLKYKKTTPEFSFNFHSPIMSAYFAKFHPNLVIGGTYSGHIVLWDNRVNKRTPIQRTPISASTHTHPVYCLDIIGTQNAYNLVSASTDGRVCFWNLEMLSQPQETIELQTRNLVAPLCMDFPVNDYNNFVVGCEDGNLYSAIRHGNKSGIINTYEGHQAPVTRVDYNKAVGPYDFSHCILSSSYDWTIKLWNHKELNALHSFENCDDYVTDVGWSPVHPALFASADSTGRIDVWNLNNNIEVPTASTILEGAAIKKCRWHSSGNQLAIADNNGDISIYDISESLAQPKADEWSRFAHTLQDLKAEQVDLLKEPSLVKQIIAF